LIELLVVIAIIGILASILLAAVSKVKEKANQKKCMANLKEMGTSLALYSDTFGVYPNYGGKRDWAALCTSLTGLDPKELMCPNHGLSQAYNVNGDVWVSGAFSALTGATGPLYTQDFLPSGVTADDTISYDGRKTVSLIPASAVSPASTAIAADSNQRPSTQRHSDGRNVLYADLHVEWVTPYKVNDVDAVNPSKSFEVLSQKYDGT
jgi:prepilin-type processing-associated H-X9-DG protein